MSYPCNKCGIEVSNNDDSICCDECNHWLHLKCTSLNNSEFVSLAKKGDSMWYCDNCNTCSKCTEIILGRSICWDMCKHWFHDHCAKVKSNFDKIARSKQPWNCRDCIKNMFPFYDLDNKRLTNFLTSRLSEQVLNNIHSSTPDCRIGCKKIDKKANSLYCNTSTKCNY